MKVLFCIMGTDLQWLDSLNVSQNDLVTFEHAEQLEGFTNEQFKSHLNTKYRVECIEKVHTHKSNKATKTTTKVWLANHHTN